MYCRCPGAGPEHACCVGYAEDIDRLREYVRTTGHADYRRMREVAADCVEVQFIDNAERHAAALADLLDEPEHVLVGVLPFTTEVVARVTPKFAPHRVRVYERPRMTLLGGAQADL